MNEVRSRLLKADSLAALAAERSIAAHLTQAGWPAIQSRFFNDPETGKLREIDVLAEESWVLRARTPEMISAKVQIVVEAKSAADWHLVFSRAPAWVSVSQAHLSWLGSSEEDRLSIERAVFWRQIEGPLPHVPRGSIFEAAYLGARPRVADLLMRIPTALPVVAGFAETNVGSQKAMDASVLWRAVRVLQSAVDALSAEFKHEELGFLVDRLEGPDQHDLDPNVEIQAALSTFAYHHPVVVMGSPMWLLDGEDLRSISAVRMVLIGPWNRVHWWVDVVSSDYWASYLDTLTSGYAEGMLAAGAVTQGSSIRDLIDALGKDSAPSDGTDRGKDSA